MQSRLPIDGSDECSVSEGNFFLAAGFCHVGILTVVAVAPKTVAFAAVVSGSLVERCAFLCSSMFLVVPSGAETVPTMELTEELGHVWASQGMLATGRASGAQT